LVTAGMVCAYIMLLIIYAFFWQKLLKCIPLSTAYLSKGLLLFWLLLWAFLIFNEKITLLNIIGVGIIFSGTLLVNTDG
jgi:drug/metabolite transporter (DMT)-like permease